MKKNFYLYTGIFLLISGQILSAARPTVRISASPATISAGQSSTLTWSSTNAATASIDNGIGSVPVKGSTTVSPAKTTTYKITVRGSGGTATASAKVTVKVPAPTVTISASPATISAGQSSTLTWSSTNATSASIDNGIGSVPVNGTKTVTPTKTTTYTITVNGSGGTATAKTTVTVKVPAPTVTISASPATISAGQSSTLTWSSANATSASIDNGIGSVPVNGTSIVTPAKTTTYTITVKGSGGTTTASATVTVNILPTVTISASPMAIKPGESSTLKWSSTDGNSASIDNGVGNVALNGSTTVSPAASTVYTITVTGSGGTAKATASVYVGDGKRYVAYLNNCDNHVDFLTTIDLLTKQIGPTKMVEGSNGVLFSSRDGLHFFCEEATIGDWPAHLYMFDPASFENLNDYDLYGYNLSCAKNPDDQYLYFLNINSDTDLYNLWIFKRVGNTKELSFIAQYFNKTYTGEWSIKAFPDGSKLYIIENVYPSNARIMIADTSILNNASGYGRDISEAIVNSFQINENISSFAFVQNGNKIYASTSYTDKLLVMDSLTGAVITSFAFPRGSKLFPDPKTSRIYVWDSSNTIYSINTENDSVIESASLGNLPNIGSIDIFPDGSRLYALQASAKKMLVIDTQALSIVDEIDLSSISYPDPNPVKFPDTFFISYVPPAITGKVICAGKGLADSSVHVAGESTDRMEKTDANGSYTLSVKQGRYNISFEKIGYSFSPAELTIDVNQEGTINAADVTAALAPPTATLSADPPLIKKGASSLLKFKTANATTAVIDNAVGEVAVNCAGEKYVAPIQTTVYTITVTGPGGTATANATITVADKILPTVTITAEPMSILAGESTKLSWNSVDAKTASINNGIGNVALNGSLNVSPLQTTTYIITAANDDGSASSQVTVNVQSLPGPTVQIQADPLVINPPQTSTLTWTTTNAQSVSIDNGIGIVPLSGSITVSPTQDTTYTITATGSGGTATASINVKTLYSHLVAIWNEMRTALSEKDINRALTYFSDDYKPRYNRIFNDLLDSLPQIASEMADITPLHFIGDGARFTIRRKEIIKGIEYEITHDIYFVKGEDGVWRILKF